MQSQLQQTVANDSFKEGQPCEGGLTVLKDETQKLMEMHTSGSDEFDENSDEDKRDIQ